MNPSARWEEPERGRGQPFVPLFSGRRVLVVVFNQLRGMSCSGRERAPTALQNHDPCGLSMRKYVCAGPTREMRLSGCLT